MTQQATNHIDADSIVYAMSSVADRVHFVVILEDWTVKKSPYKTYEATIKWQLKEYPGTYLVRVCKADPLPFVLGAIKKKLKQIEDNNVGYKSRIYVTGSDNFRFAIPNLTIPYKGNRSCMVSPTHLKKGKEYLVAYHEAEVSDNCEADDDVLINYRTGDIISCIDKDLYQLPATFYNYNSQEHVVVTAEEAAINFWTQVWIGDKADNIPGLSYWCKKARIGPKKIQKALELCEDRNYINLLRELYLNNVDHECYEKEFDKRLEEQCVLLWLWRERGVSLTPQQIEAYYKEEIDNGDR